MNEEVIVKCIKDYIIQFNYNTGIYNYVRIKFNKGARYSFYQDNGKYIYANDTIDIEFDQELFKKYFIISADN